MSTDALSRGARGGAVVLLGQLAALGIQFLGVVLLSRVLTPVDFGLMAMVLVFLGIGELIRDFGLPAAALQARHLDRQQASNIFWATVILSLVIASLFALSAPAIAALYNEPRLTLIVPAVAGVLFINGVQAQFQVQLSRQLRFMIQTWLMLGARVAGLSAGLAAALSGAGYWSLVIQMAVASVFLLGGCWIASRWMPARPRRGSGTKLLFVSGFHNGAANMLGYAADNVDTLMIGYVWGPGPLGIYNRAFQLFMSSVMSFFNPLTRVIVPTANRAITEGRSGQEILARAQTLLCGAAIGVLSITAASAEYLVPLLLGEQWRASVPLLQILAIGGAFKALSQTNYWAYLIEQQSKQLLWSNLITKPIQIALVITTAFISVEAVAWAFVLGRAITWPINLVWLKRTAGYSIRRFGLNGVRLTLFGGIGYAVAQLVLPYASEVSDWFAVFASAGICAIVYGTLVLTGRASRHDVRVAMSMIRGNR